MPTEQSGALRVARVLAPVAWAFATVGYFGPWIAHETAALTLSGVDMGEFVKFLPPVLDSSLQVVRQLFYLPPVAVVGGVALLACSRELRYPWELRVLVLALAVPVSLQLLPPAWSSATLMSTEFRLQTVTIGALLLLLAGTWLWGRLSLRVTGLLTAAMALVAAVLSAWQFGFAKPAIDAVYSTPPGVGWGFFVCLVGLAAMTVAGVLMARQSKATKWDPRRTSRARVDGADDDQATDADAADQLAVIAKFNLGGGALLDAPDLAPAGKGRFPGEEEPSLGGFERSQLRKVQPA